MLSVVQVVAISSPKSVRSERFSVDLSCLLGTQIEKNITASIEDLSMTGAGIQIHEAYSNLDLDQWIRLDLPEVGSVAAYVQWKSGNSLGVAFEFSSEEQRSILLEVLFTRGLDNSTDAEHGFGSITQMLGRVLSTDNTAAPSRAGQHLPTVPPPAWLKSEIEHTSKAATLPPKIVNAA